MKKSICESSLRNNVHSQYAMQKSQWPTCVCVCVCVCVWGGGGGGKGVHLSNGCFLWKKWNFCSEIKKYSFY